MSSLNWNNIKVGIKAFGTNQAEPAEWYTDGSVIVMTRYLKQAQRFLNRVQQRADQSYRSPRSIPLHSITPLMSNLPESYRAHEVELVEAGTDSPAAFTVTYSVDKELTGKAFTQKFDAGKVQALMQYIDGPFFLALAGPGKAAQIWSEVDDGWANVGQVIGLLMPLKD
jgi:hypothetical protein